MNEVLSNQEESIGKLIVETPFTMSNKDESLFFCFQEGTSVIKIKKENGEVITYRV